MLSGKTKSGFSFEISDESLDNMELIETLAGVDKNPLLLPRLVSQLLGEDQKQELYDHLRTDSGVVPVTKVSEEIMEIFQSDQQAKNS